MRRCCRTDADAQGNQSGWGGLSDPSTREEKHAQKHVGKPGESTKPTPTLTAATGRQMRKACRKNDVVFPRAQPYEPCLFCANRPRPALHKASHGGRRASSCRFPPLQHRRVRHRIGHCGAQAPGGAGPPPSCPPPPTASRQQRADCTTTCRLACPTGAVPGARAGVLRCVAALQPMA